MPDPQTLARRTLEGILDASKGYFTGTSLEEGHVRTLSLLRDALGASRVFLATSNETGFHGRTLIGASIAQSEHFARRPLPPFPDSATHSNDTLSINLVTELGDEAPWLAELVESDSAVLATGRFPEGPPICVVGIGGLDEVSDEQRVSIESFVYLVIGTVVAESLDAQRMLARNRRTSALETLIDEVEGERRRMSHQIHDGVLQNVTSIAHFLETMSATTEDQAMKVMLERLRVQAQGAAITLRQLVTEFEPEQHATPLLAEELHNLSTRISGLFGLTVRAQVNESANQHPAASTVLWVSRQALDNALTHADASTLSVTVDLDVDDLTLIVEDDGKGFDAELPWSTGVGLRSMERRVRDHGGTLQVDANIGVGTRIVAIFPNTTRPSGERPETETPGAADTEIHERIRKATVRFLDQDIRPTLSSIALNAEVERSDVLERFASVDEVVDDAVASVIDGLQKQLAAWPPIDTSEALDMRLAELLRRRFLLEQWGRPIRNAVYTNDPTARFDHEVIEAIQPELNAIGTGESAHLGPMLAWLLRPRSIRAIVQAPTVDPDAASEALQFIAESLLDPTNHPEAASAIDDT